MASNGHTFLECALMSPLLFLKYIWKIHIFKSMSSVSALRDVTIQNWFTQFIGFHPFLCSFDQKIIEHNAHACVAYRI